MSTVCHHLSHGPLGCQGLGLMVPSQIQILESQNLLDYSGTQLEAWLLAGAWLR